MCLTNPSSSKGLESYKNQFDLPRNSHYFCGHSLGPMPIQAKNALTHAIQSWSTQGVLAWHQQDWLELNYSLGEQMAQLIGAQGNEVVISDSTSVNLYKVLYAACQFNPARKIILVEKSQFPADLYIAQGLCHQHDMQLKYLDDAPIFSQLDDRVSVLLLSHVDYRSSYMHSIQEITKKAHEKGIIIVWDLSHSVGAMPFQLHHDNVDMAVGCTYKYLSGGPGAPSFIYVHERLHSQLKAPIQGWFGHQQPFAFNADYHARSAMSQFIGGTPYIFSLKALQGALSFFSQIDLQALRQIAIAYADQLIDGLKPIANLKCISPLKSENRGNHVAFRHPKAQAIHHALIAQGIICDFRVPDVLRFGINPLYQDTLAIETCINTIKAVKL